MKARRVPSAALPDAATWTEHSIPAGASDLTVSSSQFQTCVGLEGSYFPLSGNLKNSFKSMGKGNTMVELRSFAITFKVER